MPYENRRIGVLIGPTSRRDDEKALDSIFDSFNLGNVNRSECNIIPISQDLPFFAVEVNNFDASKALSEFSQQLYQFDGKILKITMTSIYDQIDNNLTNIYGKIKDYIDGNEIDLSNLPEKVPRTMKLTFPPNLSTMLFLVAMYVESNNINLEYINLSNSEIRGTNGFRIFAYLFPDVKRINLSGNLFDQDEFLNNKTYLFPNIEIIFDNPDIKHKKLKKIPVESLFDFGQEKPLNNIVIPPPPIYSKQSKPQITLDDYKCVILDNESPINYFLYRLFLYLSDEIYDLSSFYISDAVFSISIQESYNYTEYFKYAKQNLLKENGLNNRFQGIENIKKIMNFYFQGGFKSKPTSIITKKLNNNMHSVVVIGVFETNDTVYGFHRSFFIQELNNNYFITNDHINISAPL